MTNIPDYRQDKLWDSISTLSKIDTEQAKSVFNVAVERSLLHLKLHSTILSTINLSLPSSDQLNQLQKLEKSMRIAFQNYEQEKGYELLVDYVDALSLLTEGDSQSLRKKLLASLLSKKPTRIMEQSRKYNVSSMKTATILQTENRSASFLTPSEVAKKLGLSGQTVRRLCEKNKFEGAYKTDGGHWKIPQSSFVTSNAQDKRAESVLKRIDGKNRRAGEADEFDL